MDRGFQWLVIVLAILAGSLAGCTEEATATIKDRTCGDSTCDTFDEEHLRLQVVRTSLPNARRGAEYAAVLNAIGGQPPSSFAIVAGALPAGLTLDQEGSLEGSPEESGTFTFVVEAVDSADQAATARATFDLVVPELALVSGYGPFEGYPVNPAWESVRPLEGEQYGQLEVRTVQLRVVWDEASDQLLERMAQDRPAAVISVGVAGGRPEAFSLERIAYNEERGTDVDGNDRFGTPVVADGPSQLESTLPLDAIGEALSNAGISWENSEDAGRYLCNHLFYEIVSATRGTNTPAGFIHISDMNTAVDVHTAGFRALLGAVAESQPPLERRGAVVYRSEPLLAIPDQDETGVSSEIGIDDDFVSSTVNVLLDIAHTWVGDLRVVVEHDGVEAVVWDRAGGSENDLRDTLALDALAGTPISGTWRITVSDHAAQDVGSLEGWALVIEPR